MKYLVTAALTAVLIAGTAVAHDGEDVDRDVINDYDFTGFDRIDVSGVYLLDVRAGDRFSVTTEADSDSAKWMDVRLKGDTLVLGKKDKHKSGWGKKKNHDHGIRAIITMPRLAEFDVSGVVSGDVSAFTGGHIEINIGGVADVTLSGQCDSLDIDVGGVGNVDAEALECDHVDADVGGVGKLSVYASKSIEADSGGMSTIYVYGDPAETDVESSRMSKVKMR